MSEHLRDAEGSDLWPLLKHRKLLERTTSRDRAACADESWGQVLGTGAQFDYRPTPCWNAKKLLAADVAHVSSARRLCLRAVGCKTTDR
jgi:hypothetical protein